MIDKKIIKIICPGLRVNFPINKRIVELKPVEYFDYKNCVSETNFFGFNLIRHADISLSVRLIRELLQRLPAMFSPDINNINKVINKFEK